MYTYPDRNDLLTMQLIMGISEGEYWSDSENAVLRSALDVVKSYKKPEMLDVGCGMGRLFSVFSPYVKSIFAIEPDRQRYVSAVESAAAVSNINVDVVNSDSACLTEEQQFDVVLSSHVLQHIPNNIAESMVADMASHTAQGGCIIVTTTHTECATDELTVEYFENNKRICANVSEQDFIESFSKEGVLPVRLFSERSVPTLFAKYGFDYVQTMRYYHYYVPGEKQSVKLDMEKNANGDGHGSRDILFIFKRSSDCRQDEIRIDAGINFQYSFSISDLPNSLSYDEKYNYVRSKLISVFPESISDDMPEAAEDPVLKDITIARDFLHGTDLPFDCHRFIIKGLNLKLPESDMTESAIILTLFPEFNTATLMMCFTVNEATTDQMVYYRQIFAGSAKFCAESGEEKSLGEWFNKISSSLGKIEDTDLTYLIELKAMHPYTDVNEVLDKESRRIYGMLCGDEGWEYVPEDLAKYRIENQWGSREFVKFVVFGSNAVLLNFNRSELGMNYVAHQRAFGEATYGGANPYFLMNSDVAGINHGIIFSQETVLVIKTIANRVLHRQYGHQHEMSAGLSKEIRKTKKFRSELITILNRVENLGITEIGELEQMLLRSYKITPLIDSIKYMLELMESELDLLYQQSTNRLVNILTIAGLILTAIDVFSGL